MPQRSPDEAPRLHTMAAAPLDDADRSILDRLARLADLVDPMPPRLVERITFGVAVDELHAEVARIQGEAVGSARPLDEFATPHKAMSGSVRSSQEPPVLSFGQGDLTVTIVVGASGNAGKRVDGWLDGSQDMDISLRCLGETLQTRSEGGRFCFDGVPAGFGQIVVRAGTAILLTTPAFDL